MKDLKKTIGGFLLGLVVGLYFGWLVSASVKIILNS